MHGSVPEEVPVREGQIRYLAAPWTGQKTGAFLDQRPNRLRAAELAVPGGQALDCFAYHGSFALHLARRCREVVAIDTSPDALARGVRNAELNDREKHPLGVRRRLRNPPDHGAGPDEVRNGGGGPPAFAKSKNAVAQALRGYHEINLRAMKLLAPGGVLLSASCSFHVRRPHSSR